MADNLTIQIGADTSKLRSQIELAQVQIQNLRRLARGIHPAVLSDRGLGSAVEAAAYFVVAEAITNVARYAQATHAAVDVHCDDGTLVVEVTDDGIGGADPSSGSGLRGLSDRIAALDGRLEVSSPAGAGTTVRASIPA